jgi:hypothetical protein
VPLLGLIAAVTPAVASQAGTPRLEQVVASSESITVVGPAVATNNAPVPWRIGYALDAPGPYVNASITATADTTQSFAGVTASVPPDWSVSWSSDGTTFTPTPTSATRIARFTNPLLPRRATGRVVPVPPPPDAAIDANSTGDGYVPTILGGRAYMVHHHHDDANNPISCTDLTIKQICPGYPTTLGAYANNAPGAPVVVDGTLWFKINDTQLGLVCIVPATGTSCGRVNLVSRPKYVWEMGLDRSSQPVAIGTKIYLVVDDHQIHCLDVITRLACSGYPKATALVGRIPATANTEYEVGLIDVAVDGNRLYVSFADDMAQPTVRPWNEPVKRGYLHCFDVGSGQPCSNWATPVTVALAANDRNAVAVFFRKDAAGNRTGVCLGSLFSRTCVGLDGTNPTTKATPDGMWGTFNRNNCCSIPYLAAWHEAEGPTRTFHAAGGWWTSAGSGVFCWDWTTDAPCSGNGYTDGLRRNLPPNSGGGPYGFTTVGTCAWGATDSRKVFSFSVADGTPGCKRYTFSVSVRPRSFYCDGNSRPLPWSQARFSDASLVAGTEFTRARMTVVNTSTNTAVAGPVNLLGTNGSVDLSGIPEATNQELRAEVELEAVATNAWDDGVAPKIELLFSGDPIQFCTNPTPSLGCSTNPREVTLSAVTGTNATAARTVPVSGDAGCSGTVTGKVVEDADRNGTITGTDPGIAGLTIVFRRNGTSVATATTSAAGTYTVTLNPPGTYDLDLTLTGTSYTVSVDPDGTLDGRSTVSVPTAGTVTADFGLQAPPGAAITPIGAT